MLDVRDSHGSPYWKILLVSIFLFFALIVIRIWVLEIGVAQGFLGVLQNLINTGQLLQGSDSVAAVLSGQNYVIWGLKRGVELLIGVLFLYNIIYLFKQERQTV